MDILNNNIRVNQFRYGWKNPKFNLRMRDLINKVKKDVPSYQFEFEKEGYLICLNSEIYFLLLEYFEKTKQIPKIPYLKCEIDEVKNSFVYEKNDFDDVESLFLYRKNNDVNYDIMFKIDRKLATSSILDLKLAQEIISILIKNYFVEVEMLLTMDLKQMLYLGELLVRDFPELLI